MKNYKGNNDKKLTTNESEIEVTSTPDLIVELIQLAFENAKNIYQSENRIPCTESKLGIPFDFGSWLRYEKTPNEMKEIKIALTGKKNIEEIIKQLANILTSYGSLWDSSSYEHLFNNYFLLCLRRQDIDAYRKIVGQAYGICFVVGAIELYRIDSWKPTAILEEGFQLNTTENQNQPGTRKCFYANIWNNSTGISFSKKHLPCYEGDNFYKVILPKNHHFLLIDIGNSPRNQTKLKENSSEREWEEVNSLDNIPSKYIKSFRLSGDFKEYINKSFSSDVTIGYIPPRGCY